MSAAWDTVRSIDHRLTGPGTARTLIRVRSALVAVIAIRLALRNWRLASTSPSALYQPVFAVEWLARVPSPNALTIIQLVGIIAAVCVIARRAPRVTFVVAWVCFVVLCAIWSSFGKVMHNDILLVYASAPFLFAPSPSRAESDQADERWGWPPRVALIMIAAIYFIAGFQKLHHSGLEWVFSDNMSWVLRYGTPRIFPGFIHNLATLTWLTKTIAGVSLVIELTSPILLAIRRTRLVFLALIIGLHASIWFSLGLDYYGWMLTVAAVTIPMSPLADRFGQRRSMPIPEPVGAE